jgi:hypothetical protein
MIQKPFDLIRSPLKVDSAALPVTQEDNFASFDRRERIVRTWC